MDALPRFPRLVAADPFRSPDWRWQRAQSLVDRACPVHRSRDDEWTALAVRYLRSLRRSAESCVRWMDNHKDIHAANEITHANDSVTLEIQARLLARQPLSEITERTGVGANVIDAYENLFFDVTNHLCARDWVITHACQPGSFGDIQAPVAALFKRLAYIGGSLVLEAVHRYLIGGADLFDPPADLATPEGRREQRVRLAIAAESLASESAHTKFLQKLTLLVFDRNQNCSFDHSKDLVSGRNYAAVLEKALAGLTLENPVADMAQKSEQDSEAFTQSA